MQELSGSTRIEEMETFAAVAEAGSFSGASKRLGRDPSVLSRRVTNLERRLGVRLIVRTTRHLGLTEAGADYLARVQTLLAELADADAAVSNNARAPRGTLRLNLPAAFGRRWVAPVLPGFLRTYPQIRIEAYFSDRYVDIVSEGIDVAIRLGTLKESGLVSRQLALFSRILCASPDYLARCGTPLKPEDLPAHSCLYPHGRSRPGWHLHRGTEEVEVSVDALILADDGDALLSCALAGSGILLASDWLVGPELGDGRLIRVLPEWTATENAVISAVLPPGRLIPAKTRAFVDWIAASLSPVPWR